MLSSREALKRLEPIVNIYLDRLIVLDQLSIVRDRLAQAERHVAKGEQHIARQREIISELERDGHDAAVARDFLDLFMKTQELHECDREEAAQEVARLCGGSEAYQPAGRSMDSTGA